MTTNQSQIAETALRRKHRDHYLALAESFDPTDSESNSKPWKDRIAAEYDNFRNALAFTVNEGDATEALRFVWALHPFWCGSSADEGLTWATRALDMSKDTDSEERVRATRAAGFFADYAGVADADKWYESAVDMARRLGQPALLGPCLVSLGWRLFSEGRASAMVEILEEARTNLEATDDWAELALCYRGLAWGNLRLKNHDDSKLWDERETELVRKQHDRPLAMASRLWASANLQLALGNFDEAERRREESVEIYRHAGRRDELAGLLPQMADDKRNKGEYDIARALLEEALSYAADQPNEFSAHFALAGIEMQEGCYARARALYEEVLEVVPESKGATYYSQFDVQGAKLGLARVAFAEGNRGEVLSRLQETKQFFAESPQQSVRSGLSRGTNLLEFLGDTEETCDRLATAARVIEETDGIASIFALIFRANIDRIRGRVDSALQNALLAQEAAPTSWGLVFALGNLVEIYLVAEQPNEALETAKQLLALEISRGPKAGTDSRKLLIDAAIASGNIDLALEQARAVAPHPYFESPVTLLKAVETLALLASRVSDLETAGVLLGASEARREMLGAPPNTRLAEEVEGAATDAVALAAARKRGSSLAPLEAINAYAASVGVTA